MVAKYGGEIMNVSGYMLVLLLMGMSIYCMRKEKYNECVILIIIQVCIIYVISNDNDLIEGADEETLKSNLGPIGGEEVDEFKNYHGKCAVNACFVKSYMRGKSLSLEHLNNVMKTGCRALDFAIEYKGNAPYVVCITKGDKSKDTSDSMELETVLKVVKKNGIESETTSEYELSNRSDPMVIILRIFTPGAENLHGGIFGETGVLESVFGEYIKENDGVTNIEYTPNRSLLSLKNKVVVLVANEGDKELSEEAKKGRFSDIMVYNEDYTDSNKGLWMHVHTCNRLGMIIPSQYDYQNEEKCNMISEVLFGLGCQYIACDYSDLDDKCLQKYRGKFVEKGRAFIRRNTDRCIMLGDEFASNGYVTIINDQLAKTRKDNEITSARVGANENAMNELEDRNIKDIDGLTSEIDNNRELLEDDIDNLYDKLNKVETKNRTIENIGKENNGKAITLENKLNNIEEKIIGNNNAMSNDIVKNTKEINMLKTMTNRLNEKNESMMRKMRRK